MSEPVTLEFIFNGISEDEVVFPHGDILSYELPEKVTYTETKSIC